MVDGQVLVDTDVTPLPRQTVGDDVPADAFGRGRATVELALALLLTPDDPPGIRELAREVDLAPSTVSQSHARLVQAPSRLVHTRATATGEGEVRQVPTVVSALDLARDRSLGRGILAGWTQLPDGRPTVWRD